MILNSKFRFFKWIIFLGICFGFISVNAQALTKVNLQLRWEPQFQFAGYYIAQAKGFYKDEGLDVNIVPGAPGIQMVEEVLSRRADFAIGNSGLALEYLRGKPVVVLADIFQKSAAVLVVKPGHEKSLEKLKEKNLALRSLEENPELYGIFSTMGIQPSSLANAFLSDYKLNDFISGKADAINAYLSNEPYFLKKRNVPFVIVDPAAYGVDFYGDAIFTHSEFVQDNPEIAKSFVRASIKGWIYALNNMPEAVQYLKSGPAYHKDLDQLSYEATVIKSLIMPDYIPVGQVNPERWERIAQTFKKLGLAAQDANLQPEFFFSYWLEKKDRSKNSIQFIALSTILVFFLGFGIWYWRVNLKLRKVVKEKEGLITEVQKLANFDVLTGLPNRRLFLDRLTQAIKLASRTSTYAAVIYVDLDRFKDTNDSLGHDGGDELLKVISIRLTMGLRESDTVSRIGGDEFVVLLSGINRPEDVEMIVREFIKKISDPILIKGQMLHPAASFGIAIYPNDGVDPETLLISADQAMYAAKSQGINNHHYFTQSLQVEASYRARVITELRAALADEQFELFYQPIVRLSDGEIVHAEALVRWRLSSGELVMPGAFIEIAEESGQIVEIGDWVFQESLRFLQSLPENQRVTVAVNISAAQLNSPKHSALEWIDKMHELNVSPSRIVFEVTERLMMLQSERVSKKVGLLQEQGCLFSVDDFGTGFSSLASLKNFNFDYIKIDYQFVRALHRGSPDESLVNAMLSMAKGLGLKTIAEGVEALEQAELLKEMGCDFAQGYYFSKPISAHEFRLLLSKSNKH